MTIINPAPESFGSQLFDIVVFDFAWNYKTYSDKGRDRSPDRHYSVMTLEMYDKLQRSLHAVTHRNTLFFHWVITPFKFKFFEVVNQWQIDFGMSYRTTAFVWVKLPRKFKKHQLQAIDVTDPSYYFMGMGYHTRQNTEEVWLLRHENSRSPLRENKGIRQLIVEPIGAHSEKPDELFKRIDLLYGTMVTKLEIFARKPRTGWTTWGNEVTGNDIFDDIVSYKNSMEQTE